MKLSVNLASRPFVELRPFFAKLRLIMAVLAAIIAGLLIAQHIERKKLDVAQRQMDSLRNQTIAAQKEKLSNEARMRQPVNAEVLERARFLNALFLRKSFSWTAVMMDLENVLPTGVQVTAIEPAVTADGDVVIRLRVSGDRDRAVQLVRNLERSSRFLRPRLSNETTQTREQAQNAQANGAAPGGVEFDILSNYNPLPAPPGEYSKHKGDLTPAESPAAETLPGIVHNRRPARPGPNDGVVLKPFTPRPATPRPVPARPAPLPKGAAR